MTPEALELIRELRARGDVSRTAIAHTCLHVLETCDRMRVLQNGQVTCNRPTAETSIEGLLTLVGAEHRDPGT